MSWAKGPQSRDWSYKDIFLNKFPDARCRKVTVSVATNSHVGYRIYKTQEDEDKNNTFLIRARAQTAWEDAVEKEDLPYPKLRDIYWDDKEIRGI